MRPSGADIRRSCAFCRHRKMKCSGEKPWCRNCKERSMPCVYDSGTIRIKKHEHGEEEPPHHSTVLLLPTTNQTIPLLRELHSLFNKLWDRERGCWSRALETRCAQPQAAIQIDYQHGLSQILAMTIATLAGKTLPFSNQLHSLKDVAFVRHGMAAADEFTHVTQQHVDTMSLDKQRLMQLVDLAYCSHPFLPLIVSRTLFMKTLNQGAHDKVLLDAVLVASLGLKGMLVGSDLRHEELCELETIAHKASTSLFSVLLGALSANKLQSCVQSIMLLAWHDLTQGFIRRSSTWWTMACDLILRVRSLRACEDVIDCQINGVDIASLRDEELDHMQAVCQLMLLWFEASLGPIPVPHALLWRSPSRSHPAATSALWELDDISGNVASTEGFVRARRSVHRIQAVLTSLAERYLDFKNAGESIASDDNVGHQVDALLLQASLSGPRMAGPIITLSALLLCFQRASYISRSMDEGTVASTIRACAAAALQLRGIFGDASRSNDDLKRIMTGGGSFSDTLVESSIALSIFECVALTFGALMTECGAAETGQAPFVDGTDEVGWVSLSAGAQQMVFEKLGVVMGIVCTMVDCFDSIPVGGGRSRQIGSMLQRLRSRLEALRVQADVSFAFEVTRATSSLNSSQETRGGLKEEGLYEFDSGTLHICHDSAYAPTMLPATQHGGPSPTIHCSGPSTSLSGGAPGANGAGPSSFEGPHDVAMNPRHCVESATVGHVVYGPGPMSTWRQGVGSTVGGEDGTWLPEAKMTEARSMHMAKGEGYLGAGGFAPAEFSASSYSGGEVSMPMSIPMMESGFRRAGGSLGGGLSESLPTSTLGKGFGRTMAHYAYGNSRGMSMLPINMLCKWMRRRGDEAISGTDRDSSASDHGTADRQSGEGGRGEAHGAHPGAFSAGLEAHEGGLGQGATTDGGRKRARAETHAMRQIYSGSKPVVANSSGGTGRRVEAMWAEAEGGQRAMPAVAALASMQRIEPLTDTAFGMTASTAWPGEIRERATNRGAGSSASPQSEPEQDHI